MKKVFLITTLISGLLTSCADNSTNETVNSTDTVQTIRVDSSALMNKDSIKAREEKRLKDSAAHGHTH